MKMWWIVALGLTVSSAVHADTLGSIIDLKDADGKIIARGVLCSSCKTPGENCHEGAVDGWLDGKPSAWSLL